MGKKSKALDQHLARHSTNIRQKVKIDTDLRKLIPALQTEEIELLRKNILEEGVREALIVWHRIEDDTYWLVDGHHRWHIAQEHRLDLQFDVREFKDRETVEAWMINNQLGRRNLTPEQMAYLRGKQYQVEKKRWGREPNNHVETLSSQNANSSNQPAYAKTVHRLADEHKVHPATIHRNEKFAQALDFIDQAGGKDLSQQILTGEVKIPKRDLEAFAERVSKQGVELMPDSIRTADDLYEVIHRTETVAMRGAKRSVEIDFGQEYVQLQELMTLLGDESQSIEKRLKAWKHLRAGLNRIGNYLKSKEDQHTNQPTNSSSIPC